MVQGKNTFVYHKLPRKRVLRLDLNLDESLKHIFSKSRQKYPTLVASIARKVRTKRIDQLSEEEVQFLIVMSPEFFLGKDFVFSDLQVNIPFQWSASDQGLYAFNTENSRKTIDIFYIRNCHQARRFLFFLS